MSLAAVKNAANAWPHEPELLHVHIYAALEDRVPSLRNAWNGHPAEEISELLDMWRLTGAAPGYLLRERLHELSTEDAALLELAAALKALDLRHAHREDLRGLEVELAGGRTAIVLPTPPNPVEAKVASHLFRGPEHFDHVLSHILALQVSIAVLPTDWRVVWTEAPPLTRAALTRRVEAGSVRVGAASPLREVRLKEVVRLPPPGGDQAKLFVITGVEDQDHADARLELTSLAKRVREQRVDVLVIPELTLDPPLAAHLGQELHGRDAPALIIAGTFHEAVGTHHVNRCRTHAADGAILMTQDKAFPFTEVTQNGNRTEDIACSTVLQLLETPIGRIATPICIDFFGGSLPKLLEATRVTGVFVPAMTRWASEYPTHARQLGTTNRAFTVVANSGSHYVRKETEHVVALFYVPARSAGSWERHAQEDELHVFDLLAPPRTPL